MDKKVLLIAGIIVVIIAAFALLKPKKTAPVEVPAPPAEVSAPADSQIINMGEEIPALDENQDPNALDYMAPGHRQARERLKRVQDLRKQALDAQKEDMERYNLK